MWLHTDMYSTLPITRHTSIGSVLRRLFLQFCLSSDVESGTHLPTTATATATVASTAPMESLNLHLHVSRFLFQHVVASSCLSFSLSAFAASPCLSCSLLQHVAAGDQTIPGFLDASSTSTSSPRPRSLAREILLVPVCLSPVSCLLLSPPVSCLPDVHRH